MSGDDRLTPELQALLAAERDAPGPDAGVRDRLSRKLASTLGVTLAAAGASGAATSGAHAALPKALLGKSIAGKLLIAAIVGGVAVGGVATTVVLVHRHGQHAPAIAAPPPRMPMVAPPSAPVAAAPVATTVAADPPSLGAVAPAAVEAAPPVPAPSAAARADSRRVVAHHAEAHHAEGHQAAGHPDLAAERALLTDARAAMQAADAPRALAILDDHEHRFARGQLAEERDALRVAALWLAGDHAGARRHADEFARRHPDSLFLPSVRRAVTDPAAATQ